MKEFFVFYHVPAGGRSFIDSLRGIGPMKSEYGRTTTVVNSSTSSTVTWNSTSSKYVLVVCWFVSSFLSR